ncbi:ABC transporter substrate-binding protein [Actinomadura sp. 1N219]|uniref:ABC transporter substrate-binding protein n=1 Tax=Actinomadura sp. 1N219 TaxID=3375152 RepID=UPI0037B0627C
MNLRMWAAAGLACSLALAGCGRGEGEAGSGDTLKLALVSTLESRAYSLPFMEDSARAAVKALNERGGVAGKTIELTVCNDRNDQEELRRCLQSAVRDGAVGVVGLITSYGSTAWPILEAAGLPALVPAPLQEIDGKSAMSYPLDSGSLNFVAFPEVARTYLKAESLVPVQLDEAYAAAPFTGLKRGAEQSGTKVMGQVLIPPDAVDFAPYIARAKASGAAAIAGNVDAVNQVRLWQALKKSGTSMPLVITNGIINPDMLKEGGAAAEGTVVVSANPFVPSDAPGVAAFAAEMKKFAPGKPATSLGMRAWAGVQLAALAMKKIDGDVTRKSFVKALNSIDGETVAWAEKVSFAKPGPVQDYPRIPSWTVYPGVIKGGAIKQGEPVEAIKSGS